MGQEKSGSVRYNIADFAKMVGVEPSTVRYYERHGLPGNRRDDNGYRVFSEEDAFRMNIFRSIYCRGFSINEAIHMMEGATNTTWIERLKVNCRDTERELLFLKEKKRWMEETLTILKMRETGQKMLWRCQLPDFYYLPASVRGDFSMTQKNGELRSFWQEHLPFTRFVGISDGEEFCQGKRAYIDCGEAVRKEHFIQFDYPVNETVQRLNFGDCICFYVPGGSPDYLSLERFPEVQKYLEDHGLEAVGRLLLFYMMMNIRGEGDDSGIAVLPVKPILKN